MQRTATSSLVVTGVILVVMAMSTCTSLGRPATEVPGTPSSTGCDAWFEIQGTFSQRDDIRYTLRNRSTNPRCSAARVHVLFVSKLRSEMFRVSVPPGWTSRAVSCSRGPGSCGFEWRADEGGVPPGQELRGFGLSYVAADAPYPKSWIVDVGRRRVEMPIGTVGG